MYAAVGGRAEDHTHSTSAEFTKYPVMTDGIADVHRVSSRLWSLSSSSERVSPAVIRVLRFLA